MALSLLTSLLSEGLQLSLKANLVLTIFFCKATVHSFFLNVSTTLLSNVFKFGYLKVVRVNYAVCYITSYPLRLWLNESVFRGGDKVLKSDWQWQKHQGSARFHKNSKKWKVFSSRQYVSLKLLSEIGRIQHILSYMGLLCRTFF